MSNTTEITEEQYNAARTIAAEYERKKAEEAAVKRAAYAIPVEALVKSPEYLAVWTEIMLMLAEQEDDGFFKMPVEGLSTIMRNLAAQVGLTLVLPTPVEPTTEQPTEGE